MTEAYTELARRILERPARLGRTRLVAVDGPSGAGKSLFASRLARALAACCASGGDAGAPASGGDAGAPASGGDAGARTPGGGPPVVQTDDLLEGWADQFTFWPRLEQWVLAPLRTGRSGHYRRYDWVRRRFGEQWIEVPPAPVVILEGVSAARRAIRPELSFAVFVTAPAGLRRERALARDGAALLPYLEEWWRGEAAHFAADGTREHVDLVVDVTGGLPHDPATGCVRRPPNDRVTGSGTGTAAAAP